MKRKSLIQLFILLITASSIFIASCQKYICTCERSTRVQVFNDSLLNKIEEDDSFGLNSYWKSSNEPILENIAVESYRFSIRAAFSDYRHIYRIERQKEKVNLNVKKYDMHDSLVDKTARALTELEWINFKKSVDDNCFWATVMTDGRRGLDGSDWILEGFKPRRDKCANNNYHFIYRWSPSSSSSFVEICNQFIALDSL